METYIANLSTVYGTIRYAPYRDQLEPKNEMKQLQQMFPKYRPNVKSPEITSRLSISRSRNSESNSEKAESKAEEGTSTKDSKHEKEKPSTKRKSVDSLADNMSSSKHKTLKVSLEKITISKEEMNSSPEISCDKEELMDSSVEDLAIYKEKTFDTSAEISGVDDADNGNASDSSDELMSESILDKKRKSSESSKASPSSRRGGKVRIRGGLANATGNTFEKMEEKITSKFHL